MQKLYGIIALAAFAFTSAAAAAPLPTPTLSWTGFYVGGAAGTRWADIDGAVTSSLIGTPPAALPTGAGNALKSSASRAGVFAGWNWEVSRQWVGGVEADFGWADSKATRFRSPYPSDLTVSTPSVGGPFPFGDSANDSFSARTIWDSSLRLRAGWLMAPSVLLFATGGVAWLQLETTSNCSTVPRAGGNCATDNFFFGTLGPSVITHSQTRIGWTVGAGVEAMLWPNWLARAEYRHADFGTANFTDVRSCTGGCDPVETSPLSISYALRVITRTATIGLAYKFGN